MRVVGGKPDASGRREALIVWTVPGGPADLAGLQQGDKVRIEHLLCLHRIGNYCLLYMIKILGAGMGWGAFNRTQF